MAEERLSALQKWILVKCYQKTIERDNSGLTILHFFRGEHGELLTDNEPFYWTYLFRQEILADFFRLNTTPYYELNNGLHAFTGFSGKEQASLTRSLKNLEEKGLVTASNGGAVMKKEYADHNSHWLNWQGIGLTEAGIDTALALKVNV